MEARKLAIISGIYANTNLDGKASPRQKMIQDMEDSFKEAIAELYDPAPEVTLEGNPFFDAMNVPGADIDWEKYSEENPPINTPTKKNQFEDLDIDQA